MLSLQTFFILNKDENFHRYTVRKEKEIDREREISKEIFEKITNLALLIMVTHQGLPSVSITPKSMTYRDDAYLKKCKKDYLWSSNRIQL